MPLRDGAAIRRERLQMIVEMVRKQPGIHIRKLQIQMGLKTGLTGKRVSQYVNELVEGEILVEEDSRFRVAGKR